MKITAAEVRAKYPEPIAAEDGTWTDGYCVGGALCLYRNTLYSEPYPPIDNLAAELLRVNFALSEEAAMDFAYRIAESNDRGDFEYAWTMLDAALTF